MTPSPVISLVMPVKNGAARIERAIDSVATQDWPRELIVIDGASTDGTLDILARRRDVVAHVESGPDNSATEAVNRGVAAASGDVIAMLMSDDWLAPEALRAVGEAFAANPAADVISGGVMLVDEREGACGGAEAIAGASLTLDLDRLLGTPYPAAYFFRKSLWNGLGGLSCAYRYGADRDLLMRCRLAGGRHLSLPVSVYHYSVNEGSDTLVEKPEVVKAFLRDHCLMAGDWLARGGLTEEDRRRVRAWRREQVMNLAARHVADGEWPAAASLLWSRSASDPAQIIAGAQWLGRFGSNALARKFRTRSDSGLRKHVA